MVGGAQGNKLIDDRMAARKTAVGAVWRNAAKLDLDDVFDYAKREARKPQGMGVVKSDEDFEREIAALEFPGSGGRLRRVDEHTLIADSLFHSTDEEGTFDLSPEKSRWGHKGLFFTWNRESQPVMSRKRQIEVKGPFRLYTVADDTLGSGHLWMGQGNDPDFNKIALDAAKEVGAPTESYDADMGPRAGETITYVDLWGMDVFEDRQPYYAKVREKIEALGYDGIQIGGEVVVWNYDKMKAGGMAVEKPEEDTLDAVRQGIDSAATGLDLTDSDDRAIFRQNLTRRFKNAKASALLDYARAFGVEPKGRSRDSAIRALAQAWIEPKGMGVEKQDELENVLANWSMTLQGPADVTDAAEKIAAGEKVEGRAGEVANILMQAARAQIDPPPLRGEGLYRGGVWKRRGNPKQGDVIDVPLWAASMSKPVALNFAERAEFRQKGRKVLYTFMETGGINLNARTDSIFSDEAEWLTSGKFRVVNEPRTETVNTTYGPGERVLSVWLVPEEVVQRDPARWSAEPAPPTPEEQKREADRLQHERNQHFLRTGEWPEGMAAEKPSGVTFEQPSLDELEQGGREATNDPEGVWRDVAGDLRRVQNGDADYRFLTDRQDGKLTGVAVLTEESQQGVEVPEDYIVLGRIASNSPGTGTRLLRAAAVHAAGQGKGLTGWAIPGSRGFFRKMGMSTERAGISTFHVWWTPEQVREFVQTEA